MTNRNYACWLYAINKEKKSLLPGQRFLFGILTVVLLLATACTNTPTNIIKKQPSPPVNDATYGNGHFGHWITDRFGLPAFVYTADEAHDPAARWSDLQGNSHTTFWHQIGNDRIVANAYNDGYVQLWDQERQYRVSNTNMDGFNHYAGGFGYLNDGKQTWSTLYLDRPAAATFQRTFGVGYYEKQISANGLTVQQVIFAPFGDDPVLLSHITLTNTSKDTRSLHYVEYWDVNPEVVPPQFGGSGPSDPQPPSSTRYDAATRTLFAQPNGAIHPTPHTLFLSSLSDAVTHYETSTDRFFGKGNRSRPDEIASGNLSNTLLAQAGNQSSGSKALFAMQANLKLDPGKSHTLVYAYGYGDPNTIGPLVKRLSQKPKMALEQSMNSWRIALPILHIPQDRWLERETIWNAYYLRSSYTYEDAWHTHIISQGYAYQYQWGTNTAYRDPLQHDLPTIYLAPSLARDTIRFAVQAQPKQGDIPYGFVNGKAFVLGQGERADDLDLWLLWTTAEYVLATRDFTFLDEVQPYFNGTGKGTIYEHLVTAYQHQLNGIRFGPHGEFKMLSGDWSDGEGRNNSTESTQTTALAAWIFPYLAQLADAKGDHAFAAQARAQGAKLRQVVAAQWTGHWFNRGYKSNQPYGVDSLYINQQPWAILADAASPQQAATTADAINRLLSQPSPIGAASQSPSQGYGTPHESGNGEGTTGGIWYALNGPLIWAFAGVDPSLAYREYKNNTHAAYAEAYPNNWYGVLSGPDSYNSFESKTAGQAFLMDYPVQDAHSYAWQVYDTFKLAGIQPTESGYSIDPHWPFATFSWDSSVIGVSYAPRQVSGHVHLEGSGTIDMHVRLPQSMPTAVTVNVNNQQVSSRVSNGFIDWQMPLTKGQDAMWTIQAATSKQISKATA